ncbi:hypothetical protein BD770DRAFT_469604 [Pilaira anomala]|nr:hypothetical protein BD770DRAFT_469604 [Pilaira anomala]
MLTESHLTEFRTKGYTILENALDKEELELLYQESNILSNHLMSEGYDLTKDLGCIIEPWTCGYLDPLETNEYKMDRDRYSRIRNEIYWPNTCTTTASRIILDKYGRTWAAQLLEQTNVYLLNEQFIVKPPLTRSSFEWHRDSDYYKEQSHREIPSVACWTALDEVTEENGTIQIIDFLGLSTTIRVPSSTVVFMSDKLLHKSTNNTTLKFRRVYMVQFSTAPLLIMPDHQPLALAIHTAPNRTK